MPAGKLGLGVAAQVNKNNLDGDALAYCSRSGANRVVELTQFARGVKSLGLWNSMVSWLLLPGQNAGQGATAYSFGGQGIRDLQLNLATWSTSGVVCNVANAMLSGNHSFNLPLTIMGVHRWDGGNTIFCDSPQSGGPNNGTIAYYHTTPQTGRLKANASSTYGVEIIGPAFTNTPFQPQFFGTFINNNPTRIAVYANNETPATSAIGTGQTTFGPRIVFGNNNAGIFSTGRQNTTVFACIVTGLSGSYNSIRNLYINTLGREINLP